MSARRPPALSAPIIAHHDGVSGKLSQGAYEVKRQLSHSIEQLDIEILFGNYVHHDGLKSAQIPGQEQAWCAGKCKYITRFVYEFLSGAYLCGIYEFIRGRKIVALKAGLGMRSLPYHRRCIVRAPYGSEQVALVGIIQFFSVRHPDFFVVP